MKSKVGLSATPGKNIENIRLVVSALRINKIEARIEHDPDVKKYVHERNFETIIVETSSHIAAIDNLFKELIYPLLDKLRRNNALKFRGGNQTVTAYTVMMAMKDFKENTDDQSLYPYFMVAQPLLRARDALRENGLGLARSKLASFMQSSNRGFGLTICNSDRFKLLWKAVINVQGDGKNPNKQLAVDLKVHNPKLEKLEEILLQHFERARACKELSRVIVFSQWRESVEEIVRVLEGSRPLLRPKKFVGQSSVVSLEENQSPSSKSKKSSKVNGMNQKEQQRVIQEFRDDKINVLVCTVIGEGM